MFLRSAPTPWSLVLGLFWLASAASAQSPDPRLLTVGELPLMVAVPHTSALPLAISDLEGVLCPHGGGGGVCDRSGEAEDCRIVVVGGGGAPWIDGVDGKDFGGEDLGYGVGGGAPDLTLKLTSTSARVGGGTWANLEPIDLAWASPRSLCMPCEQFTYRVALDPEVLQPRSRLLLQDPTSARPTALASGTLSLAVVVRFEGVSTGTVVHVPLPLDLDFAARWTVGTATGRESNLVLFADRPDRDWIERPGCGQDKERCGSICLTARPETVTALGSPPR